MNNLKFEMSEQEFTESDDEMQGMCIACGEPAYGVEPDAEKYDCESCEEPMVYGMQELLIMGRIKFV